MHKCCDGLAVQWPPDSSHLAKTIEAAGIDVGHMPVKAEVGHYVDAKQAMPLPACKPLFIGPERLDTDSEMDKHVVWQHAADTHSGDVRGGCRDNKVEYVTALVCCLSDVLHASERLQQLSQANSVWVISYIDVDDARQIMRFFLSM